ERAHAMDQVVAQPRPFHAGLLVADVVAHAGGAWGEDGEIGAARALQLQLGAFQAVADLVVRDLEVARREMLVPAGGFRLALAEIVQLLRLGGVVPVTVDDHPVRSDLAHALNERSRALAPDVSP